MKPNCKYSINALCEAAGFTKQAHYTYLNRRKQYENLYHLVFDVVTQIRRFHTQMGLRKIWYYTDPDWIGRDNFIKIGIDLGLEIPKPKNYQRTTFSTRCNLFGNLTANLEIYDINKVWVSDITYFFANGIFYYITLVQDVYSRRILGWSASQTLRAESCCNALKLAIKTRSGMNISNLIHHSDKGSQYTSDAYLKILKEHNIAPSMCDSVYENSHIERLNGIIKNEYLKNLNINSFKELISKLNRVVNLYNNERAHFSLGYSTPIEFENRLLTLPSKDRKVMILYSHPVKDKLCFQSTMFN